MTPITGISQESLGIWLVYWALAAGALYLVNCLRPAPSIGLMWAYVFSLSMNHFFGAFIHALPWFSTSDEVYVHNGFRLSVFGLWSLLAGFVTVSAPLANLLPGWKNAHPRQPDSRLPAAYLVTGFVFYIVLTPILGRLPSIRTLSYSGWSLMIVGFSLSTWAIWKKRQGSESGVLRWLMLAVCFPLFTAVNQGFLGFGIAALIVIFAFVSTFYRPRWKVIVGAMLAMYLGLSLFVTYFRDRAELRQIVWYQRPSVWTRLESVADTLLKFEWIDFARIEHLERIDERLNLNTQVGMSIEYLYLGYEEFARGGTLVDAACGMIPRILWPGKPARAGGNELVSKYTGLDFSEETSVGIGQVMEFYVNFGLPCVIVGFFLFGALLGALDRIAGSLLARGDWQGCVLWFLAGVGMVQAGGSLVDITMTVVSSMIFCLLVNGLLLNRYAGRILSLPLLRRLRRGKEGQP